MPLRIALPPMDLVLEVQHLDQDLFSDFGTVIENPAPSLVPSATCKVPPNAVVANQGTALKYLDVTEMRNFYASGVPSERPGKAVMNMFVCAPRSLLYCKSPTVEGMFPVQILERHPYTTQTFIPLSQRQADETRYLVIVAPSLPPSSKDECFPVPSDALCTAHKLPGRGLPDLTGMKAFVADTSQAVTYGAGTWHAPMVVIGKKTIDFVVVQFANGSRPEDCQEVEIGEEFSIPMVAVPYAKQASTCKL